MNNQENQEVLVSPIMTMLCARNPATRVTKLILIQLFLRSVTTFILDTCTCINQIYIFTTKLSLPSVQEHETNNFTYPLIPTGAIYVHMKLSKD